jgi:Na+/proline symporter
MDQASINFLAVFFAVVAKQALGFAWYSRALFGRTFAQASGQTDDEMRPRMARAIAGDIVGALAMAVVLAHMVSYAGARGALYGALVGLLCWLGFAAPASLSPSLFERRPVKLWALQNGYLALTLAVMGAILGGWR